MVRVGIIGPESTGKSTLAKYLAKRYKGVLVPEYAREYVESRVKSGEWRAESISFEEVCEIAKHQINLMQRLEVSGLEVSGLEVSGLEDVVFFDTELIVTKVWFEYAFGQVPEWLEEAIKRYPMDVYLLTYPDIEWHQDGARYNGSDEKRMELFRRYEAEIQALDIPYYIIKHS